MTKLVLFPAAAGAGVVSAYFGMTADYGRVVGAGGSFHRRGAGGRALGLAAEGADAAVAGGGLYT